EPRTPGLAACDRVDRRPDPLVRDRDGLCPRRDAHRAERPVGGPGDPGAGGLLRGPRPVLSPPGVGVPPAVPPVRLDDGGDLHRAALLLRRRPAEPVPLVLPALADLLLDPISARDRLADLRVPLREPDRPGAGE